MRSVEAFLPWVRNIVVVTDGQVPIWLNLSAPNLRLITHSQIFPSTHYLPTFNSKAIEANLYNIPEISPCFLYCNDDMFISKATDLDMFINPLSGAIQVHTSSHYHAPMVSKLEKSLWHRSIAYSNEVFNKKYHAQSFEVVSHPYPSHICYFFRKDVSNM
ncbi:N-acetylglucosamine-1-phosphotransferase subunits alpha/beta [Pelomyxa schiedti]|nr:N-acetylglucosamine-1-phosphotransferase subunits alpha/beta [Pelomyxa schiedti]